MTHILRIHPREILDSRGIPTLETTVELSDGSIGKASVPSGASAGRHEAHELRDNDPKRFNGKGVLSALASVTNVIAPALQGKSPFDQASIDHLMMNLDESTNKSVIGANAILSTSLAVSHSAACSQKVPLYQYLAAKDDLTLPVPMLNILNGGRHAEHSTDIQEFMVIPAGLSNFKEALRAGAEIYHALKRILQDSNFGTNVGDEGGFAPSLSSNKQALDLICSAIEKANYKPGEDCFIGLDVAASELITEAGYRLNKDNVTLVSKELSEQYGKWIKDYPIISIEDGLGEDDWSGWQQLTSKLGKVTQLVGDDLYTTNTERIRTGIGKKASNAVLLKPNQIGSLTETLDALHITQQSGWATIISHRSGETEDTTISDLAVAWNVGQIKAGAPCRSERLAKYNRLLKIEEELDNKGMYTGMQPYKSLINIK